MTAEMEAERLHGPQRHRLCLWRKNIHGLSCRLLCCCCSCVGGEDKELLPGQSQRGQSGERDTQLEWTCLGDDQGIAGEGEASAIHITVEDLGLANPSFTLTKEEEEMDGKEEEALVQMFSSVSPSSSSMSAVRRARKKKRLLKPLSSLPLQPVGDQPGRDQPLGDQPGGEQTKRRNITGEGEQEEAMEEQEKEEDSILNSQFLTPPVINLIPPTPSDVIDDNQFFDDIISDEESVAHTSGTGSDGSSNTAGDQEDEEEEERMEDLDQELEEGNKRDTETQERQAVDGSIGYLGEPDLEVLLQALAPEREGKVRDTAVEEKERPKPSFLRSAYQVAPLPDYPRKRSFNSSINLLLFTEHNLDDWRNADASCHELLRAELRLLPLSTKMEALIYQRKPGAACSCSLGGATPVTVPRSHTFHSLSNQSPGHAQKEEESPRQRRITVASFMPQSNDQNGNFPEKDSDRQTGKPLGELNTEEVCQWFSSIGLQKSLQFIREAELCGADIASIDLTTLDVLHVSSLQEREQLLSAVYRELHPPSTTSQRLDLLLETLGPNNVEKFTAALVNMSKSKSSPQINCLNMNRMNSFKFSPNPVVQRNSQLMEVTINASEQVVHLHTPRETTVGKVMEGDGVLMLGMTDNKDLFSLTDKPGSSEELIPDQHISDLVSSENQQLQLQLCRKETSKGVSEAPSPGVNGYRDNRHVSQNHQIQPQISPQPEQVVSQPGKEEQIRELNQQVDSLQNVILQVQEIHHSMLAFCSELKSMDVEVDTSGLSFPELEQRLGLAMGMLRDKTHSLQSLRETMRDVGTHRNKPSEVCLLDKMKLNCQVFNAEISLVYLNRQVSHLQTALQDSLDKACGGEWGTVKRS